MNTRRILMVVAMLMLTLSFSAFTTVGSGPAVSGTPVPGTGSRIYLPLALNSGNGDNWKQYANELYDFALEYPADWVIAEYTNTPTTLQEWNHALTFDLPKDAGGMSYRTTTLYVWNNTENLSFMEWAGMYVEKVTGSSRYVPASPNARIAGEDTLFYLEPREQTWGGVYALLEHESKVYLFEYDGINNGADYPTFVHMLETFEFEGKETKDALPQVEVSTLRPTAVFATSALGENTCGGYTDPNGNWYQCSICSTGRNCVWWASYIRPDIPPINLGDAAEWNEKIASGITAGLFTVDGNPQIGAIAVFEACYDGGTWGYNDKHEWVCFPSNSGIGSAGHVGYVTGFTNNTVTTSQMNCGGTGGPIPLTFNIVSGQISFIHAAPTLFEHTNFQGEWRHFETSNLNFGNYQGYQYHPADEVASHFLNDTASSLWLPPRYSVALYKNANASCPMNRTAMDGSEDGMNLDRRWIDFTTLTFTDGSNLNDNVSGIAVVKDGCLRPTSCGASAAGETVASDSDLLQVTSATGGVCSKQYAATWLRNDTPDSMTVGNGKTVTVNLRNDGSMVWEQGGATPVHIAYHWLNTQGATVVFDGARTSLPRNIGPGESTGDIQATVNTPTTPGTYILRWSPVFETVAWFESQGVPTLDRTVNVTCPYTPGQGSSRQQLFLNAYNRNGGMAKLGCATSGAYWWGPVVAQNFTGSPGYDEAVIFQDEPHDNPPFTVPAYVVHGGIWYAYRSLGGPQSFLGSPASDEYFTPQGDARYDFGGGYITWNGGNWQAIPWNPDYAVTWLRNDTPTAMGASQTVEVWLNLRNEGRLGWQKAATHPTHLTYHWVNSGGQTVIFEGIRTQLPFDLPKGVSTGDFLAHLQAPPWTGSYTLKWTLVHEGITWFENQRVWLSEKRVEVKAASPPPPGGLAYGAVFLSHATPTVVSRNTVYYVNLNLRNTSSFTWERTGPGFYPVHLAYHWVNSQGGPVVFEGLRTLLPQNTPPGGDTGTFPAIVHTPGNPGTYVLQWTLVHEGVTWFESRGTPKLEIWVTVQ